MKRAICLALACAAASPATARAYHAATHAGMTERAALASALHKRLIERFGRALGLFEPLTLEESNAPARRELDRRLAQLDPEGGYLPDRGRLTALSWLSAGAALEAVPAARLRNHFYDPSRNRGLDQTGGEALRTRINAAANGVGSVRGIFTGESFDGSGLSAPDWLRAPENEWGLSRFNDELERAAAAPAATEREGALARALLAAGSILHVLEDMGDPTFVRDDYRVALEADAGPFERYVALQYGRLGVPEASGAPLVAPSLNALFHDGTGDGLADHTQARFFSPGTLPDSGRYGLPQAAPGAADSGYVAGAVRHLAHYQRAPDGTFAWTLDARCWRDYAAALLPETTRYAASALDLLFRGRLEVDTSGGVAAVTLHEIGVGKGKLSLYADLGGQPRQLVRAEELSGAADGAKLGALALPAGTRKVAVVFRGVDKLGEPLVIVQEAALGH